VLKKAVDQTIYLHYYTDTTDYFIYEYDGEDAMFDTACSSVFPNRTVRQKIRLASIKEQREYEN